MDDVSTIRVKIEQNEEENDAKSESESQPDDKIENDEKNNLIAQLMKAKAANNETFYLLQKIKEKLLTCENERDLLYQQLKDTQDQLNSSKTEINQLQAQVKQLQSGIEMANEHNQTESEKKSSKRISNNQFEVERILSHKKTKRTRYFLIKWLNYDSTHDSWVAERNLNCPGLLNKYLRSIH